MTHDTGTTPHPVGTVIRLYTDPGPEWDARPGIEYVITNHVPHDPADNDPPADCYELEPAPGQGHWSSGEYAPYTADLGVLRTAEEQATRMRLPDGKELADAISCALHSSFADDLEVYETTILTTAPSEESSSELAHGYAYGVEVYGRRRGGVGFGFTLRLTSLWRTDD